MNDSAQHGVSNRRGFWAAMFMMGACMLACVQANDQNLTGVGSKTEQRESQAVALAALKEFDARDYEATWARAGTYLRSLVSQDDWPKTIAAYRGGMDKLITREFTSYGFGDELKGAPPARYVILMYHSDFGAQKVNEKIVLVHEDDQWKLAGYFVRRPSGQH